MRSIGLTLALIIVVHLALTSGFIKAGDATTHFSETMVLLSGIALVFIGGAWLSWAVFQGITTKDWEYYGILGSMVVSAQGCLSILLVSQKSRLMV